MSRVLFAGRVLAGRRLIDPVEAYFLPETDTLYPINSKAGCSSVKLALVRRYAPETQLRFPEIHVQDPAELTGGKVERHFFLTRDAYRDFCRGRRIVLVTRDPYARIFSAYEGYRRGINRYYRHYARLRQWFGFDRELTFEEFVQYCCRLPARYADRHFRPQSFYLPAGVKEASRDWQTTDITEFGNLAGSARPTVLNASGSALPPRLHEYLRDHGGFQARYAEDLTWYGER
ncbi:sulfotransferase family 2 domain-containing protein [Lewinella sp. IMCC34183]|uniref:sulfotransferase family 2 domain-containing protein n=1 Tax=Lewinella sp. IMCC34183 TaxID=2248762 RepID=UPI000E221E00|nr:sulfotransferase family 2 domain-containing protein [Lewinella sp. IMCC34183]